MAPSRRLPPPEHHARKIAAAAADAWQKAHGPGDIDVPVSVVAALALTRQDDPATPGPAARMLPLDPSRFRSVLSGIWSRFALLRPDLLPPIRPFFTWLDDDPYPERLDAARAVGRAVLHAGLMDLTGDVQRRWQTDLLGAVMQELQPPLRTDLGQYLTPADVSHLMGSIMQLREGTKVLEPTAGTGALVLGAARAMRAAGRNPARVEWIVNDIDRVVAACLAVNLHLWGLGQRVLVGCGDGLDDTWIPRARSQQQAAVAEVVGMVERIRELQPWVAAYRRINAVTRPDPERRAMDAELVTALPRGIPNLVQQTLF